MYVINLENAFSSKQNCEESGDLLQINSTVICFKIQIEIPGGNGSSPSQPAK